MSLFVLLQVFRQFKGGPTKAAGKRFHIHMNGGVSFQILLIHESFFANIALETQHSGVSFQVRVQSVSVKILFVAHVALEARRLRMTDFVDEQSGALGERLPALVANVGPFSGVGSSVGLRVPFVREAPPANVARVLFDALVHETHVIFQEHEQSKLLAALLARVRLLSGMLPVVLPKSEHQLARIVAMVALEIRLSVHRRPQRFERRGWFLLGRIAHFVHAQLMAIHGDRRRILFMTQVAA